MKEYRLWACKPTAKNMRALQGFPHFKAGPRYCLVIDEKGPKGAIEITGEHVKLLTERDWNWILQVRDELLMADEAEHREELTAAKERFLSRFEAELLKRREGEDNAGDNQRGGQREL